MALLGVDGLVAGYGNILALKGVSLAVDEGEVVTLIGSNGAGKTTLLRTISGLVRARGGTIAFAGRRIEALPPHQIVQTGISQAPEGRGIFARLSVEENLLLGGFSRGADAELRDDLERVLALFPRLQERLRQPGGTLSGGEQQMLAIGRAIMSRPRLLLLDEPSMGLSPVMVETIFRTVLDINRAGTTVLLVEQNASLALAVASRGYVLESGAIVAQAPAAELRENELVRRVYLGEGV